MYKVHPTITKCRRKLWSQHLSPSKKPLMFTTLYTNVPILTFVWQCDPQPFFLHRYIRSIPNLVQFILINVPNLNKEINNALKVGVTMWQTLDLFYTDIFARFVIIHTHQINVSNLIIHRLGWRCGRPWTLVRPSSPSAGSSALLGSSLTSSLYFTCSLLQPESKGKYKWKKCYK